MINLKGAWQLTNDDEEGMAVFTDTHFSMIAVRKDLKRFAFDAPSEAEAAGAFKAMNAAAGSYEVSGNTVTFMRVVNRNPNWAMEAYNWKFERDGDELVTSGYRWKRLSD